MAMPTGLNQQRRGGLFGSQPSPMRPAMTAQAQPMKKGFDWGKLIGVLGDSLSIAGGGQASYVPNLIDQRQRATEREQGLQDWAWKQQEEAKYRSPAQPHRWERNDGSLMELGPDGAPVVKYEDPTPKMMFLADGVGGGRWVEQPRPTAQKPSAAPTTLPKDFNEWDADGDGVPGVSAAPTQANVMGRAEYQMFVKSMGQAATDRWLASQGIQVGNH